ncbi:hypothetical protein AB0F77_36920 [Streptomyces sp. NPDC026672]|uniref:hypothetical protein n=1 Tax=unclassified Streptomyces TaxID=2593676 RepID=UPI0033E400C1
MTTPGTRSHSGTDRPPLPRRAAAPGRPTLTLVGDSGEDPFRRPVELRTVSTSPMPPGVRGALVTAVDASPDGRLQVVWLPAAARSRLPAGRILLAWRPVGHHLTEVTARLALPGGEVLLATWPTLGGEWSEVVRPTVAEVRELHAALRLATDVLERLADRPN